jgi:hypothetical protein
VFRYWIFPLLLTLLMGSAQALDDPMRPPGGAAVGSGKAAAGATFVLSSTLIARERRSAVINGRNLGIGDRINGARVVEIQPSQVRLQLQGRQITLSLLPVAVKKPVSAE